MGKEGEGRHCRGTRSVSVERKNFLGSIINRIRKLTKTPGSVIHVKVECGGVKLGFYFFCFSVAADEEKDTFTLKEIKERVESTDGKSWKPIFKEGVLRIEVEAIERGLESFSATEDIRYDFTFYTPSCRDIRVKVF